MVRALTSTTAGRRWISGASQTATIQAPTLCVYRLENEPDSRRNRKFPSNGKEIEVKVMI
jgi:hypothetical protein